MKIRQVFFDVANTLLYKPFLFPNMQRLLKEHGYSIPEAELRRNHKLLSECYRFPDKTSKAFYEEFNADFLLSLGVIPDAGLLEALFGACTYLPWAPFEDTGVLGDIPLPIGVISNWDRTLPERLQEHFLLKFDPIFVSEMQKLKKPAPEFFMQAVEPFGLQYGEVLYVGDSLRLDIQPALGLGMRAVLIDRESHYPHYRGEKVSDMKDILKYL